MFFGALAALSLSFQYPSTTGPAQFLRAMPFGFGSLSESALLALVAAGLLARAVLAGDTGTAEMRVISDAIREGAEAFLARQYRTIGILAAVLAVVVFLGYYMSPRTRILRRQNGYQLSGGRRLLGLAGYTGMYVSIRANIRTASAARLSEQGAADRAARRGGHRTGGGGPVAAWVWAILFFVFGGLGDILKSSIPACRVWLWGFAGCAFRAAWRRHLHQGCRRGGRSCW